MRKTYEKPLVELVPHAALLMQESSGVANNPMGKEKNDVVEEDEEEASLVEKEAAPMAFSNNYLKKVWD